MKERMYAAVIPRHGGYDVLEVREVDRPCIQSPGDVVVRVRACALNHLDLFARRGLKGPGVREIHLPRITGVDVAGDVVEVGPGVDRWRPGDRVVVYSGLNCGRCEACRRGEETMCPSYRIFGEDTDGGLAQYCVVPAANLEPLPSHVSYEEGAAIGAAYTTAWRMVVTVGQLQPYERVLVLGASGGVGCAALQIARRIGAAVIAVTAGDAKVRRLQELGAQRVVDRRREDFLQVVHQETGGRGVDLVVNPVGGATWRPAINSLAIGGRMTICGATTGDTPEISIREIYQKHRRILGAPMGSRRDFRAVLDLVTRGELQPVVDRVLPLDEIAEAHRLLEEGHVCGKVVVRP